MNVNGQIKKMNGANKVSVTELTPQLQEAFNYAKLHEKKVIKVQALVRGRIVRKQTALKKPSRKSSRK